MAGAGTQPSRSECRLTFGLFLKDVLQDLAQCLAVLLVLSPRQLDPHIKGGAELEGGTGDPVGQTPQPPSPGTPSGISGPGGSLLGLMPRALSLPRAALVFLGSLGPALCQKGQTRAGPGHRPSPVLTGALGKCTEHTAAGSPPLSSYMSFPDHPAPFLNEAGTLGPLHPTLAFTDAQGLGGH